MHMCEHINVCVRVCVGRGRERERESGQEDSIFSMDQM